MGKVENPLYQQLEAFPNGLMSVTNVDNKKGLLSPAGKLVIACEYDSVWVSEHWVHCKKQNTDYLFTTHGQPILQLDDIQWWYYPEEDYIRLKKDGKWGVVDLTGKTIIPFEHTSLGPIYNGWMSFFANQKWGWIDTSGRVQVAPEFDEVGRWDKTLWWGRKNGGYNLYDFFAVQRTFDNWKKIETPKNGMGAVKTHNGWRFVDENLQTIIQLPPIYDWVEHFSEALAAVKCNGLWGFINVQGEEVIAPRFESVRSFLEGLALYSDRGAWGYIDKKGNQVIPAQFSTAGSFKNGRARVGDSWCFWYIDCTGNAVSEPVAWDDDEQWY